MNPLFFLKSSLALIAILVISSCSINITPPTNPFSQKIDNSEPAKIDMPKKILSLEEKLTQQSQVEIIEDWEELKDFFENNSTAKLGNIAKTMILDSSPDLSIADGLTEDDYSKTNAQVTGVDEADILKTDGRYVYALSGSSIFIVDAYPGTSAKFLAEIKLENKPRDFFIADNRLSVFGTNDFHNRGFVRESSYSYVKIFDTSDKSKPEEIRHLDIEGDYIESRLIGDYIYFLSSMNSFRYTENDSLLPKILENNMTLGCEVVNDCAIPEIYYLQIPYESYNLTSVNSINIQDAKEDIEREFYILPNSQNIFVSHNNLYLTYTKYLDEHQLETEVIKDLLYNNLSAKSKQKITAINQVDDFILNDNEKNAKIRSILDYFIHGLKKDEQELLRADIEQAMISKYTVLSTELEKTVIHKIRLSQGDIEYQASGEVRGDVLNQFSMNENDGNFFIATTKNKTWFRYNKEENKSSNSIYSLDQDLKPLGVIEGLAEGEQIYSVRFMQDRAYMVTSEKVDPLFVVDLSQADNMQVLGKLKIPEFSTYLHPYDNNTLIGLGRNVGEDEQGRITDIGVKLSLFDVSDVENLREIDNQVLGGAGSDSMALNNHKAFLFSRSNNLLSIPVSIRNSEKGIFGTQDFDGAILFNVTTQGFFLKGLVDHSDMKADLQEDKSTVSPYLSENIKRSLYINDIFYSFSDYGMKLSSLKTLNTLKSFSFDSISVSNGDYIINTY